MFAHRRISLQTYQCQRPTKSETIFTAAQIQPRTNTTAGAPTLFAARKTNNSATVYRTLPRGDIARRRPWAPRLARVARQQSNRKLLAQRCLPCDSSPTKRYVRHTDTGCSTQRARSRSIGTPRVRFRCDADQTCVSFEYHTASHQFPKMSFVDMCHLDRGCQGSCRCRPLRQAGDSVPDRSLATGMQLCSRARDTASFPSPLPGVAFPRWLL